MTTTRRVSFLLVCCTLLAATKGFSPLPRHTQRLSSLSIQKPLLLQSKNNKNDDEENAPPFFQTGALEAALQPVTNTLDELTGGWALSYADLSPATPTSATGAAFLSTNLAFSAVGGILGLHGDLLLGTFVEMASIASFAYHYLQLQAGVGQTEDRNVKLALLLDYAIASSALLIGGVYILLDPSILTLPLALLSLVGVGSLLLCWVYEQGISYILLHSMWHLCSATSAYVIGAENIAKGM